MINEAHRGELPPFDRTLNTSLLLRRSAAPLEQVVAYEVVLVDQRVDGQLAMPTIGLLRGLPPIEP